jgi:hypothetical protein
MRTYTCLVLIINGIFSNKLALLGIMAISMRMSRGGSLLLITDGDGVTCPVAARPGSVRLGSGEVTAFGQ